MERAQAEAILDGDRETVIGLLLRLDELVDANQRLVDANERLEVFTTRECALIGRPLALLA